jgi:hypothetical protein
MLLFARNCKGLSFGVYDRVTTHRSKRIFFNYFFVDGVSLKWGAFFVENSFGVEVVVVVVVKEEGG